MIAMARLFRTDLPDGYFHVTSRGVDGCPIFRDDRDRLCYITDDKGKIRLVRTPPMTPADYRVEQSTEVWIDPEGSSRCQREMGSFSERCRRSAFAIPKLPSEFSKSIGLTLCGMVDEPISPALVRCLK